MEDSCKHITTNCPHCMGIVVITEINCSIFRHGVLKSTGQQIHPHATQQECKSFLERDLIYGCGKPFQLIQLAGKHVTRICEYIWWRVASRLRVQKGNREYSQLWILTMHICEELVVVQASPTVTAPSLNAGACFHHSEAAPMCQTFNETHALFECHWEPPYKHYMRDARTWLREITIPEEQWTHAPALLEKHFTDMKLQELAWQCKDVFDICVCLQTLERVYIATRETCINCDCRGGRSVYILLLLILFQNI